MSPSASWLQSMRHEIPKKHGPISKVASNIQPLTIIEPPAKTNLCGSNSSPALTFDLLVRFREWMGMGNGIIISWIIPSFPMIWMIIPFPSIIWLNEGISIIPFMTHGSWDGSEASVSWPSPRSSGSHCGLQSDRWAWASSHQSGTADAKTSALGGRQFVIQ